MVRKLRIKLISITLCVLLIMVGVILITLNVYMRADSRRQTRALLSMVTEYDGAPMPPGRPPSPEEEIPEMLGPEPVLSRFTRFFYAKVNADGEIIEINRDRMLELPQDEAERYVHAILEKASAEGFIEDLQYYVAEKPYGRMIALAERGAELGMLARLTRVSLWSAGFGGVLLLFFVILVSDWAVRPVKLTLDKQKAFISDASHELKTPLTIIQTSADVLENSIGPVRWLLTIRAQALRMSVLVKDLLTLARTEAGEIEKPHARLNMSQAALNATLEFESLAYEAKKTLRHDIAPNVFFSGVEDDIARLFSILIDNAIVHSRENAEITVKLAQKGRNICFSVYNTGNDVPDADLQRLFERFYRSDSSRSRDTGGYGLGLSIAHAIAAGHRGKIQVTGEQGKWILFEAVFPSAPYAGA